MTYRTELRQVLSSDEGTELKLYKCSENFWTIGTGRNLQVNGISQDEADLMLDNDIKGAERGAKSLVSDFNGLSDNVKIVLVSMVFQMGKRGVSNFKNMLQAIEIGAFDVAAIEMLNSRWAKQTPNRAKRLAERMKNAK